MEVHVTQPRMSCNGTHSTLLVETHEELQRETGNRQALTKY